MPRLSFITPAALVLLITLPLTWALATLTPRHLAPWRFWSSLILRSLILLGLILALAGTQIIRPIHDITTIFLIDASDSITPAQRLRAQTYIEEALHTRPAGAQAAIIVFGENALVEHAPTQLTTLGPLTSVPVMTRTNIQDAIQLGLALLPADTQKRLILLSDGGENTGNAIEAARLATIRNVPIDIVPLLGERGPDVLISALDAPATAHEGQNIPLTITMHSTITTTGTLRLFVDGQLITHNQATITITPGTTSQTLSIPAGNTGFRRLEARLDAQNDSEPQNNRAAAFTEVQGPPRLLLIASDTSQAQNLHDALAAAGMQTDIRTPDQAPGDLTSLGTYAGIILIDTRARDLPRALLTILPTYVRELGRGFAMIGGEHSFGAGGYRRTPIEQLLPVNLDPLDTQEQPDLAIVMVIDRSGSMSESGSGSRTKLDLAKEAVYQASLGLSQQDQIGLVVFDDQADWIVPLQKLPAAIDIEQALSQFAPGGGTNIRSGVEQAAAALTQANARIKHVILLTDGIADRNYDDIIKRMHAAGTTITTVAIGDDADPSLEQIAQLGGGKSYAVRSVEDVPNIFLQEVVRIAGRDIVEEKFTPTIARSAPIMRGITTIPPLYGYNGTEIKTTARAILLTPEKKPLLATWQYGLGRSVAWTSDLTGRWAKDWLGWDQFVHFTSRFADMLLPPPSTQTLTLHGTTSEGRAILELTAQNEQGQPLSDLTLESRLIDPTQHATPLTFTQIGAGHYRAIATTTPPGIYLAQIVASANGQPIGTVTNGVIVSYSPEYSDRRDNPQLLRDLAATSNGRAAPTAPTAFAPTDQIVGSVREIGLPLLWLVLLLWPLDIGLRRVHLHPTTIIDNLATRARQLLPRKPQPSASQERITRLSGAKQRAQLHTTRPTSPTHLPTTPNSPITPPPTAENEPAVQPSPITSTPNPPAQNEPPTPASSKEQLSRLLAAKQRARRKRDP